MELSWPSSNSRAVVGGGHYEFQNGYQQSDSEDYQHKRDKGVSHSSDEEGNSFSEVIVTPYPLSDCFNSFCNDFLTFFSDLLFLFTIVE